MVVNRPSTAGDALKLNTVNGAMRLPCCQVLIRKSQLAAAAAGS